MRTHNAKQASDHAHKKNTTGIMDTFNSMLRFSVDNKELNKAT